MSLVYLCVVIPARRLVFRSIEFMLVGVLRFFDIDDRAGVGHRGDQIRLASQKRWKLNDICDYRCSNGFLRGMDIRDYRDVVGVFDGLKDAQPLLKAWATKGMDGGAIGFVVGGFEHQGNAKAFTRIFVMTGAVQCEVQVLQNIHSP